MILSVAFRRKEGAIIELETEKKLGTHRGYWFHTIGQRKGLGLSGGPWFVVKKDMEENTIYVSRGYGVEHSTAMNSGCMISISLLIIPGKGRRRR